MATTKQITKYKVMLNKLFDKWVDSGYQDGIESLDLILKNNADVHGSTTQMTHEEITGLICETEVIMLQFGLSIGEIESIDQIID